MRKEIIIVLVFTFIIATCSFNSPESYASSNSQLEYFDALFEKYTSKYDPLCKEKIKMINQTVTFSKGREFTLHGFMADKYQVVLFYTTKNILDYELSIGSGNFKHYGGSGYSAGGNTYELNDSIVGYRHAYVRLEPNNDTVTLDINSDYGFRSLKFPFSHEDFIDAYSEEAVNTVLDTEYNTYTLTNLHCSPINTILFIEINEHDQKLSAYYEDEIDMKGSKLYSDKKSFENFGGGGTRLSDNQFLTYNTFEPLSLEESPEKLVWEYGNNKVTVNLHYVKIKTLSAKTPLELLNAIDNNTTILLDDSIYDFSDLNMTDNGFVKYSDGEITVSNVHDLSIIGQPGTKFINNGTGKNMLSFNKCKNLTVKNIDFNNENNSDTYIHFLDCLEVDGVTVENCNFYMGSNGISFTDSNNISIKNIRMENMTNSLLRFYYCNDLKVIDSEFLDNEIDLYTDIAYCNNILLEDCLFYKNKCVDIALPIISTHATKNVITKNSYFINNSTNSLFEDLTFKGNIDIFENDIIKIVDTIID